MKYIFRIIRSDTFSWYKGMEGMPFVGIINDTSDWIDTKFWINKTKEYVHRRIHNSHVKMLQPAPFLKEEDNGTDY